MIRARTLTAAVFLALGPPASAARISLVVLDREQAAAAAERAAPGVKVLAFEPVRTGDPIEKGRFLAEVQASDRVISATGGKACGWLARETDGVPIHCVVPYDARQVLDFARTAGWRRIAVVHMEGYEKVFARMRKHARARGIELEPVRIARIRELPGAVPLALKSAQAMWILGDPLLTEGAGFDYLVETALARKIPLLGPGADIVARGAFLGADSDFAEMVKHSVAVAAAAAGGVAPDDSDTEVNGGKLFFNQVLARRWGVRVPGGAR